MRVVDGRVRGVLVGSVLALAGAVAPGVPVVAAGDGVATVGVGNNYFACARKIDKSLWCWGDNEYLELGAGLEDDFVTTPVRVKRVTGQLVGNATSLTVGSYQSCVRRSNAPAGCFGDGIAGQLGNGDTAEVNGLVPIEGLDPVGLASGYLFSCGLIADGTVWCFGSDDAGKLGNGAGGDSLTPTQVRQAGGGVLKGVTAIAAGHDNGCAIRSSRTLWCWGYGGYGVLARDSPDDSDFALRIEHDDGSPLTDVVAVDVGLSHICAIRAGGELWCWGDNEHGQLGDGSQDPAPHPVRVQKGGGFLQKVTDVSAGPAATCAIATSDHLAFCWGSNSQGEAGIGSLDENVLKPVAVKRPGGATIAGLDVSTGDDLACVVRTDRAVFCMGYNDTGGVGDGTQHDRKYATRVDFPG